MLMCAVCELRRVLEHRCTTSTQKRSLTKKIIKKYNEVKYYRSDLRDIKIQIEDYFERYLNFINGRAGRELFRGSVEIYKFLNI